jgi:hypothetical protein
LPVTRETYGGKLPKIFVDCSTIAIEDSAAIRERLETDSRLARSQLTSTSSQNPKRRGDLLHRSALCVVTGYL